MIQTRVMCTAWGYARGNSWRVLDHELGELGIAHASAANDRECQRAVVSCARVPRRTTQRRSRAAILDNQTAEREDAVSPPRFRSKWFVCLCVISHRGGRHKLLSNVAQRAQGRVCCRRWLRAQSAWSNACFAIARAVGLVHGGQLAPIECAPGCTAESNRPSRGEQHGTAAAAVRTITHYLFRTATEQLSRRGGFAARLSG